MAAELISQQGGFDVVLLDSKCFPILDTDTTTTTDFWKSNRKVLAASRSLYTKLTGSSTNPKHANTEIDLTSDEDSIQPPSMKRCHLSDTDSITSKLDQVVAGVKALQRRNDLTGSISSLFECVICKDVMQVPQFSPCCQCLVGCRQCVNRWFEDHNTCPHCSTPGPLMAYTDLRGFDEVLTLLRRLRSGEAEQTATHVPHVPSPPDDRSDDDFDLPGIDA